MTPWNRALEPQRVSSAVMGGKSSFRGIKDVASQIQNRASFITKPRGGEQKLSLNFQGPPSSVSFVRPSVQMGGNKMPAPASLQLYRVEIKKIWGKKICQTQSRWRNQCFSKTDFFFSCPTMKDVQGFHRLARHERLPINETCATLISWVATHWHVGLETPLIPSSPILMRANDYY